MEPRIWFLVLSGIALITAVESPIFEAMLIWTPFLLPDVVLAAPRVLIFLHTLLIGFGLVVVSGVPAAAFQRAAGRPRDDDVTMIVWTGSCLGLCALTWTLG